MHRSNPLRLVSRENSRLEYKRTFNWNSRANYAKTMAAFANNDGGFIFFGVEDSPHDVVGVTWGVLRPSTLRGSSNILTQPSRRRSSGSDSVSRFQRPNLAFWL